MQKILKKYEDTIYALANLVNARKIGGRLLSSEMAEILPDLVEFRAELRENSNKKWLNILDNAGEILGIEF